MNLSHKSKTTILIAQKNTKKAIAKSMQTKEREKIERGREKFANKRSE
jgi:hypothetical protein